MSIVDRELERLEVLRAAKFVRAYLECSDTIQAGVRDMLDILDDPTTDDNDRQVAIATLADALFPNPYKGQLGMDLEESERDAATKNDELRHVVDEMDREEATFAERLRDLISRKRLTQEQLAARIGVGQSAISNMLNRQCRPQKRTVLRLAEALAVKPEELWPGLQ